MIRRVLIVLAILTCSAQAGQVIVDHVDGTWTDGTNLYVVPDCGTGINPIIFYIRLVNDNTSNAGGITNGFKVWTTGGTPFTPIHGDTIPVTPGWRQMFDLVFSINHFSADGLGVDTVSFGGSKLIGTGLPVGFDKLSYTITTGGLQEGETLCIDSSYYPPTGTWLWAPGGAPSWSGRLCMTAVLPACGWPVFNECPDELSLDRCGEASYQFEAVPMCEGATVHYELVDGPGSIDPITGLWTYTPAEDENVTSIQLTVQAWDWTPCLTGTCTATVNFINHNGGDIDNDCSVNIEDLIYLVDYMFNDGPEPPVFELADVDGSGEINIADLLYMADYMFNSGPPPVDPWV